MKKFLSLILVFITVLSVSGQAYADSSSSSHKMEISTSASCLGNDHVGNEWSHYFTVNGESTNISSVVYLAPGDKVEVKSTVTENDDGRNDVGTESRSKTITENDIKNGFSMDFDIIVTENGGRYKGNMAKWKTTISFEPYSSLSHAGSVFKVILVAIAVYGGLGLICSAGSNSGGRRRRYYY